jgi:hypothetical protein
MTRLLPLTSPNRSAGSGWPAQRVAAQRITTAGRLADAHQALLVDIADLVGGVHKGAAVAAHQVLDGLVRDTDPAAGRMECYPSWNRSRVISTSLPRSSARNQRTS